MAGATRSSTKTAKRFRKTRTRKQWPAPPATVCHRLVPDRGFVFSELMPGDANGATKKFADSLRLNFTSLPVEKLPAYIKTRLPSVKEVRLLTGELRRHVFQGTLDEIRPALAMESVRTGLPAILLSEDEKKYSLVYPNPVSAPCAAEAEVPLKAEHNFFSESEKRYELSFCHKN